MLHCTICHLVRMFQCAQNLPRETGTSYVPTLNLTGYDITLLIPYQCNYYLCLSQMPSYRPAWCNSGPFCYSTSTPSASKSRFATIFEPRHFLGITFGTPCSHMPYLPCALLYSRATLDVRTGICGGIPLAVSRPIDAALYSYVQY